MGTSWWWLWLSLQARDAFPIGEWYSRAYHNPYRDLDTRFSDYARGGLP